MKEQDLDRLLAQRPAEPEEQQFQQRVRRTMRRTLYRRGLAACLVFTLLAAGLLLGLSKGLELACYDPRRESDFLEAEDRPEAGFDLLLTDAISTYFPGRGAWVPRPSQAEGFGRYSLDLVLTEGFGFHRITDAPAVPLHIGCSRLDAGAAPLYLHVQEFLDPSLPQELPPEAVSAAPPLADIRQELQDLPRSAWVDASISLPASLTAQQTAQLMARYPEAEFLWLALEGQNTSLYRSAAGGMFLHSFAREQFTPEAEAAYPGYYLPPQPTGAELEQCLVSRLQLLADHPAFLDLMASQFGELISRPRVQQRLEQAREHWACYGLRLTASPAQLLALLDELSPTQVLLNDVKLSRYQA